MAKTHLCPICQKKMEFNDPQDLPDFPFCSNRCRLIDLGKWLDGKYTIATDEPLGDHRDPSGDET